MTVQDTDLLLERDIYKDAGMNQRIQFTLNCDNTVFQIYLFLYNWSDINADSWSWS